MNCMVVSLGGWVLVHGLANSQIGIRVRTVLLTADFTTFREFHTIIQFVYEFLQRDCKIAATIKAPFCTDYKHEITSFPFGMSGRAFALHPTPQRVGQDRHLQL